MTITSSSSKEDTFEKGMRINRQLRRVSFLMCSTKVTLSKIEYLTAEYWTFKTFEKTIITKNLDLPQTSKQIYRKTQI